MLKRFIKIIAVIMAVCIMLTSCGFVNDMPLLPDKAVNSLTGAFRVFGDLKDQIKEDGLDSITSLFSSDDEETSNSDDESSSSTSNEDPSQVSE